MSTRPRTTSARWLLGAALVAALATGAVLAGAGGGHVPDGWSAHGLGDGGQLAVPDHWQVVDGGPSAGAEDPCASAAEGVLVVEASLVDRCGAHAAEPTRAIASWNRPGVPAAALAEAERIEVAGHPGLRLDDPPVGEDRDAVPGTAYVVPSLAVHLLVRDEVPDDVADQLPTTLHRDGGSDTEVVWFLSDTGDRHAPTSDSDADPGLWVVDADARVYPLVDELEVPVELAVPWPEATPDQVAHGWVGNDRLRVAVGGFERDTSMVVAEDGPVAAAAFTANGSTLLWLEATRDSTAAGGAEVEGSDPGDHDGSAVTVGLARWGEADELAEGSEPQIARHRVDGLPADLDLDRILVEIDTVGGETTAQVLDGSTDIVERAWELELEHDGPDRRLPKDARFVERDR